MPRWHSPFSPRWSLPYASPESGNTDDGAAAMILDILTVASVSVGLAFYAAGTVGILRFPDFLTRLHALTKADNVGLGFIIIGLVLQTGSAAVSVKLVLIWVLALFVAATSAALLARDATSSSPVQNDEPDVGPEPESPS